MEDSNIEFINLTTENRASEHLCCIIRSKKVHQGIEAKKTVALRAIKRRACFY